VAENVVIIGSGPAGWSAAIYAARANLQPLVFEGAITEENRVNGTLPLGQLSLTTEVENYAGFPAGKLSQFLGSALDEKYRSMLEPFEEEKHAVTGPELMHLMRQQAENFGTKIITDDIVEVDFSQRPYRVKSSEGKEVETHSVIVATGARANYLGLDSESAYKNRGVSACAVCDGALPRFRNKPLVVVGGGDSAVEEASYLSKYASTVYLIHRRDQLRASKIMQDRAFNNKKIDIVWEHHIDEVLGTEKEGVTAVQVRGNQGTRSGRNVPGDRAHAQHGISPWPD
jgi:thioredoxin reductase (NADPH)